MSAAYCESRVKSHSIDSDRQTAPTVVRVLKPARQPDKQGWPVVYVLPVEAGKGRRFGDPLDEVRRRGLDLRHDVIWAFPTFADLPWYADHPTDRAKQQEAYFLRDVVATVEANYRTVPGRKGRYLVGFSKSGWGAWSLLLRHPQTFERAAAWDAPMMMDSPGKYGSGPIFATKENFAKYQITELLQSPTSRSLGEERLILVGKGIFSEQHDRLHAWMDERQLQHTFEAGVQRKHHWDSGWLPLTVSRLLTPRATP